MFSSHSYYQQYIQGINLSVLPWNQLQGKRILLAGATGLIGTFFVDTIFYLNKVRNLDVTVFAVGRDESAARERFKDIWEDDHFSFYTWDVTQPAQFPEKVDYVIHAACDTQPTKIMSQPIEVMMANVLGTQHLLEVARDCGASRFLFLSSGSIYGQPWRPDDRVDEKYHGGLDCNTVRAAYAESKRAGETLCKSWRSQYGLDVVIARLAHVYGVTMRRRRTRRTRRGSATGRSSGIPCWGSSGKNAKEPLINSASHGGRALCRCLRGSAGIGKDCCTQACSLTFRNRLLERVSQGKSLGAAALLCWCVGAVRLRGRCLRADVSFRRGGRRAFLSAGVS